MKHKITTLLAAAVTATVPLAAVAPPVVAQVTPAQPSGLTVRASGPNAIQLTWTDNATNESGFVVSRDGVESRDLVGADLTSYRWTGLEAGTQYCFYVASKTYGEPGNPTGAGNEQSDWYGPVCTTTTAAPGRDRLDGSLAAVSVAPRAVRSGETLTFRGRQWRPDRGVFVEVPGGTVGEGQYAYISVEDDGSFAESVEVIGDPGTYETVFYQTVGNTSDSTRIVERTVTVRILPAR